MGKNNAAASDDWVDVPIANAADGDWKDVPIENPPLDDGKPTGSANPLKWNAADRAKFKKFSGEAWDKSAANPENIYAALTHVGENIPILGPMAKRLGQAVVPKEVEKIQDAEDAKFAEEHPGANFAAKVIGGAMLPVKTPQFAAPAEGASLLARAGTGLANAGLRVGAGAGMSAADAAARGEDPVEAAKTAAIVGGGLEGVIGAAKAAPWVAGKAANIFTGTREENLAKYMADRNRVNAAGAMSSEDVKDTIDNAVGKHLAERDQLRAAADAAENHLDEVHKAAKAELNRVTPLAKAQEFSSALNVTKSKLHDLSDEADDALVKSGVTFEKSHLLDAIDKIGKGAGDAVGDEATSALAKLQGTRDRIDAQLPDQIDAKRLRSVLKQIRRDIDFDQGSGEFNDSLNGMRKEFTGQISGALKDAVPEYAAKMGEMSGIAENLGHMNRFFGNDSRALGSLETLRKGGPQAQLIEEALLNHAISNNDSSLLDNLSGTLANQSLLQRMKNGEDLRALMHPEEMQAALAAREAANAKQAMVEPFERLSGNRTYGVAKNGMRDNNTTFLDKKALEALGDADKQNYAQILDDKTVHDSFLKERPNGSRMAVVGGAIGGALGHAAGHPIEGAAIGANVGAGIDKYGGRAVKTAADAVSGVRDALPQVVKDAAGVIGQGVPAKMMPAITNGKDDGTSRVRQMLGSQEGMQRLGKFAPTLQAAAAEGNQKLAVTHYMLSQQNPEYGQLFQGGDK